MLCIYCWVSQRRLNQETHFPFRSETTWLQDSHSPLHKADIENKNCPEEVVSRILIFPAIPQLSHYYIRITWLFWWKHHLRQHFLKSLHKCSNLISRSKAYMTRSSEEPRHTENIIINSKNVIQTQNQTLLSLFSPYLPSLGTSGWFSGFPVSCTHPGALQY